MSYIKKSLFFMLLSFLISCGNSNSAEVKLPEGKEKVSVSEKGSEKPETSEKAPDKDADRRITIIGVGDIMLGSNYPNKALLPENNVNILSSVEGILKEADITVGNLEGTLFDKGGRPKRCVNPSVCYVFRTPSSYGKYLKEAGFDYLSIANNHSNDFGSEGISQTMKNLDDLEIKYSGIKEVSEYAILEKDGIRYGFASFAPNNRTVSINDHNYASRLIRSVKDKVDILIVMFHGGAEGSDKQHVPRKNEIYYGEDRGDVFKFARMAVDSGADLVFGQGPHVTRAIELYKERFISYSAGNFATYGKFSLNGPNGIAPAFKITVSKSGSFVEGSIIPVRQYKGGKGPVIDNGKQAVRTIIRLNKADFPEGNGLTVSEDGIITKE